jgi:RNA polymerase sigma-70 factor (ECF subfamily)
MTSALALTVPMADEAPVAATADFDTLYRAEFGSLVGALTLYCGDADLAHDFVQEAMARACRDWDRVGRLPRPSAWVYRVSINLATSWFRRLAVARRSTRARRADVDVHLDPDADLHLVLRQAVAALPRRERQAVVLRYVADLGIAEVAEIMRCTPGTVKTLTSRATAKLRASGVADTEDPD